MHPTESLWELVGIVDSTERGDQVDVTVEISLLRYQLLSSLQRSRHRSQQSPQRSRKRSWQSREKPTGKPTAQRSRENPSEAGSIQPKPSASIDPKEKGKQQGANADDQEDPGSIKGGSTQGISRKLFWLCWRAMSRGFPLSRSVPRCAAFAAHPGAMTRTQTRLLIRSWKKTPFTKKILVHAFSPRRLPPRSRKPSPRPPSLMWNRR